MQLLKSNTKLPRSLPGFEHVRRRWDARHNCVAARILPGEFYVTEQDEAIVTVLGSCVSACVRDTTTGVGGMNHFMLPETSDHRKNEEEFVVGKSTRYGNYAMEHLINTILSHGARRRCLELKVFGGGSLMASAANIGLTNIEFVLEYINTEGFELVGQDLGGIYPRMLLYFPATGRSLVKKLKRHGTESIVKSEVEYLDHIKEERVESEVELF